jgi:sortase B
LCIANKEKQEYKNLQENMATENHTDEKSDRIEKVKELQKENSDIVAWIEIEGTNINYPVLHTTNNDFYLNYNYKKEETLAGSLFLDKDFDIKNGSSNYLIYGHRNKQGLMFEDLLKYAKEDFYKEHKKIRFTTDKEDRDYEIMAVFYSRVYYKDEQNVFRYYYSVNAKDENEYNNYVKQSKDASIYDTGVTAKYGEQLLTLSTCEYSQEDGRFVIVAK